MEGGHSIARLEFCDIWSDQMHHTSDIISLVERYFVPFWDLEIFSRPFEISIRREKENCPSQIKSIAPFGLHPLHTTLITNWSALGTGIGDSMISTNVPGRTIASFMVTLWRRCFN